MSKQLNELGRLTSWTDVVLSQNYHSYIPDTYSSLLVEHYISKVNHYINNKSVTDFILSIPPFIKSITYE